MTSLKASDLKTIASVLVFGSGKNGITTSDIIVKAALVYGARLSPEDKTTYPSKNSGIKWKVRLRAALKELRRKDIIRRSKSGKWHWKSNQTPKTVIML